MSFFLLLFFVSVSLLSPFPPVSGSCPSLRCDAAINETCSMDSSAPFCSGGLICHPVDRVCVPFPRQLGDPCNPPTHSAPFYSLNECFNVSAFFASTCHPVSKICVSVIPEEGNCSSSRDSPLCRVGICSPSTNTCRTLSANDSCSGSDRVGGCNPVRSKCAQSSDDLSIPSVSTPSLACQPRLTIGDRCTERSNSMDEYSPLASPCISEAVCRLSICDFPFSSVEGSSCRSSKTCGDGLWCEPSSSTCVTTLPPVDEISRCQMLSSSTTISDMDRQSCPCQENGTRTSVRALNTPGCFDSSRFLIECENLQNSRNCLFYRLSYEYTCLARNGSEGSIPSCATARSKWLTLIPVLPIRTQFPVFPPPNYISSNPIPNPSTSPSPSVSSVLFTTPSHAPTETTYRAPERPTSNAFLYENSHLTPLSIGLIAGLALVFIGSLVLCICICIHCRSPKTWGSSNAAVSRQSRELGIRDPRWSMDKNRDWNQSSVSSNNAGFGGGGGGGSRPSPNRISRTSFASNRGYGGGGGGNRRSMRTSRSSVHGGVGMGGGRRSLMMMPGNDQRDRDRLGVGNGGARGFDPLSSTTPSKQKSRDQGNGIGGSDAASSYDVVPAATVVRHYGSTDTARNQYQSLKITPSLPVGTMLPPPITRDQYASLTLALKNVR